MFVVIFSVLTHSTSNNETTHAHTLYTELLSESVCYFYFPENKT